MQFVDRAAGTGRSQVRFHGVVTCLRVVGNTAEIAGFEKNNDGTEGQAFNLRVVDNGQGRMAEDDMIEFNSTVDEADCNDDDSDDEEPEFALARGNSQVHDAA